MTQDKQIENEFSSIENRIKNIPQETKDKVKKHFDLLDAAAKYVSERFVFNDSTDEAIITKQLLINTLAVFTAQFQHPQQPISIEAIEKMAEKEYPLELWSAEEQIIRKLAYIKGFTSALQYSAGDNK